jgi:hypothetical protein
MSSPYPYKRPYKVPSTPPKLPSSLFGDAEETLTSSEENADETLIESDLNSTRSAVLDTNKSKKKLSPWPLNGIKFPDESIPPQELFRRRIMITEKEGLEHLIKDTFCCDKYHNPPSRLNKHYLAHHADLPRTDPIDWERVTIRDPKAHRKLKLRLMFQPFPPKQPVESTWSVRVTGRTAGTMEERDSRKKRKSNANKAESLRLRTLLSEEKFDNTVLRAQIADLKDKLDSTMEERNFFEACYNENVAKKRSKSHI